MDINFVMNDGEYDPETGTIIPRLPDCESRLDVRRVIPEEFIRWFSLVDAGPEDRYQKAAKRVWTLWQSIRNPNEPA